jgi:hypothetical protein
VSTWQDRLDSASSEIELLEVARDFVATFSPYDVCRLPQACVPTKLVDCDDVTSYAFTLVTANCDDQGDAARCLGALSSFFSKASARLSCLAARPGNAHEGEGARGD